MDYEPRAAFVIFSAALRDTARRCFAWNPFTSIFPAIRFAPEEFPEERAIESECIGTGNRILTNEVPEGR
jgi:hypothetical protein